MTEALGEVGVSKLNYCTIVKDLNSFTNLKLKFNHRKHGKHGIKEIGAQSFRAFRVFRGYNVSVNICVRDYNWILV